VQRSSGEPETIDKTTTDMTSAFIVAAAKKCEANYLYPERDFKSNATHVI
jgi:hypothetical protein